MDGASSSTLTLISFTFLESFLALTFASFLVSLVGVINYIISSAVRLGSAVASGVVAPLGLGFSASVLGDFSIWF
jgi:hypothetical protein